jgi:predicted nucleic acid-binding protein
MIYLLDTNTCIGYINRRNLSIYQRITSLSPEDVGICDIVKLDLYYGAYNSSRSAENQEIPAIFLEILSAYLLMVKLLKFAIGFVPNLEHWERRLDLMIYKLRRSLLPTI